MISREELKEVVEKYEEKNSPSLAVIGSHSALEIGYGARKAGLKSIVICQRGREKTYAKYYKHLFDEIIILERFRDMVKEDVQQKLREQRAIFLPNRSFAVYVGYDAIENDFLIPIFGNRKMLRIEERSYERNQYYLLEKAGIKFPRVFKPGDSFDCLAIVKVMRKNSVERAFFLANSGDDAEKKLRSMVEKGIISEQEAENAVIEEYILGAKFNANFFYSPLNDELELLGFDRRIQTNIDGFLDMPAKFQLEVEKEIHRIEVGHYGVTMRESQIEKIFEAGEKFVEASKREFAPGIIGLFALQGIFDENLDFYVFDVSPRIPGAPCLEPTSPYIRYRHLREISAGERCAIEIKQALKTKSLINIIT